MPNVGPSRCGGEAVKCRCMLCHYEVELQEGQKCEAVRCPVCDGRLRPVTEIANQKGGTRGPGRRDEEEGEALIWWPWPWEPKPPLLTTKKCRCPSCNYEIVVEWGARCLGSVCPRCGHMMVEV